MSKSNISPTSAARVAAFVRPPIDWVNLSFLSVAHLIGAFAVVYLATIYFSWWTVGFGILWATLCGLSITGGYHRLFAHAAYRSSAALKVFYLLFGAASVQNSALAWAADHRAHHAHTDSDKDPYDIKKGFWWAHIGWVVHQDAGKDRSALVRDLASDPLVRFQDRHYLLLAILFGVGVPFAVGFAWGDPIGNVLVAGFLRLVLQWHATFSINSLTHTVGRQTYCKRGSARDSGWIAIITLGEGYHNFHHRFQIDYRNGIRWYQFDPTKWWVWTMARFGLADGLRRVPQDRIDAARRAAGELSASA